jgi:hypothetical protein
VEWGLVLLAAVLASGLGFAGGQLAVLTDRRRRSGAVEPAVARFELEHVDGQTWALRNTGDAGAALVSVVPFVEGIETWPPRPVPGRVETVASDVLPTLSPGSSMSVWFSRWDRGARAMVSWTSDDNVRMGPVVLEVPAPRGDARASRS